MSKQRFEMRRNKEYQKLPYPDDGGLREPVRPFEATSSIFEMIRQHFANKTDLASK
jgi:hypothetical protein